VRFLELYNKTIGSAIEARDVSTLQNFMDTLNEEKNELFDPKLIQTPLYKLYLELGREGKGIKELTFLQRATAGFHLIVTVF